MDYRNQKAKKKVTEIRTVISETTNVFVEYSPVSSVSVSTKRSRSRESEDIVYINDGNVEDIEEGANGSARTGPDKRMKGFNDDKGRFRMSNYDPKCIDLEIDSGGESLATVKNEQNYMDLAGYLENDPGVPYRSSECRLGTKHGDTISHKDPPQLGNPRAPESQSNQHDQQLQDETIALEILEGQVRERAHRDLSGTTSIDDPSQDDGDDSDYAEFLIDHYTIYDKRRSLQELTEQFAVPLYISGTLKQNPNEVGVRVSGVQIGYFSIGGLDRSDHAAWAWVNSETKKNLWYRLGKPRREYEGFASIFEWKCGLVKHLLDFLEAHPAAELADLRSYGKFGKFLQQLHGQNANVDSHNFLRDVFVHAKFIYWQIVDLTLSGQTDVDSHPFWLDGCFDAAKRDMKLKPRSKGNWNPDEKTIVTPLVYSFFKALYGPYLKIRLCLRFPNIFRDLPLENPQNGEFPSSRNLPHTNIGFPGQSVSIAETMTSRAQPLGSSELRELNHLRTQFQEHLGTVHKPEGSELTYASVIIDDVVIATGDFVELEVPKDEKDPLRIGQVMQLFEVAAVKRNIDIPVRTAYFRVLWLYHTKKTILDYVCDIEDVTHEQELFYSWHCECRTGNPNQPLQSIVRKVHVTFDRSCLDLPHHYFVHRFYDHHGAGFQDLDPSHIYVTSKDGHRLRCGHYVPSTTELCHKFVSNHKPGSFILLQNDPTHTLYCLYKIESVDTSKGIVHLRMMPRLEVVLMDTVAVRRDLILDPMMENEVVYSATIITKDLDEVVRMWDGGENRWCHVEFAGETEVKKSTTLRYHGAGNFVSIFSRRFIGPYRRFIYPHAFMHNTVLLQQTLRSANQATVSDFQRLQMVPQISTLATPDPARQQKAVYYGPLLRRRQLWPRFRGCWVRCHGVVRNNRAVDVDEPAMRTHAANSERPCHRFTTSINVLMKEALTGRPRAGWPKRGDIHIVEAGNPCQGYSLLTGANKNTPNSLRKSSLIASLATVLEYYRPRYLLMENVTNLITMEAFAQFIGFLVRFGYQVRWGSEDVSHYGVAQVELLASLTPLHLAPGNPLPQKPPLSHHTDGRLRNADLKLPNGIRCGPAMGVWCGMDKSRQEPHIVLPFVHSNQGGSSARMLCCQLCYADCRECDWEPAASERQESIGKQDPRYPDHIVAPVHPWEQRIMNAIPTTPEGADLEYLYQMNPRHPALDCSWVETWLQKHRDPRLANKSFRDYTRVRPGELSATLTTHMRVHDYNSAPAVHWREGRLLSVHEAKVLQGFLPEDRLEGEVADMYRIIGNAVPRAPVFAYAVMLGEALKERSSRKVKDEGTIMVDK
ncbi:hypothetical protein BC936DRAFT_149230 [Jimgerdemannia flammicorona]|uniref:DNA (cytosine-5-)-methyltransferase n=1 Tax=Jimgerdemannia flammicorona TaxID=994334 RepID=A0A433D1A3_9FUNG|nr:hypothetical protein BC936DRAFT_149230 [Jimgerdemannia flammicorona]